MRVHPYCVREGFASMPELPEVETVCRGMAPHLEGQSIAKLVVRRRDLRMPLPPQGHFESMLEGRRICHVARRAKYIVMTMDDGAFWVSHLGMTGKWLHVPPQGHRPDEKHDHMRLVLGNGVSYIYNDPRRFGYMARVDGPLASHAWFAHLGVEPLSEEFSAEYLYAHCQHRSQSIKLRIMDQRVVVGVGNIYASEALHRSGVLPARTSKELTLNECASLEQAIREVLEAAIRSGGSTLRDYVRSSGDVGYFQHQFQVYGREGEPCHCGGVVERIVQGGRSSFYCATCQA
jgi:formamidopyrimidine-DNA glycosylase